MPGARKKSSANHHDSGSQDDNKNFDWVDEIEHETYYPKLMLEQRMNNKITFKEMNEQWHSQDHDEWDYDL